MARHSHDTWTDRFFEITGLPPFLVSCALALLLIGTFLASMVWSGEFAWFLERNEHWWENRDARMAVLILIMTALIPMMRRHQTVAAQRDLEELRDSVGSGGDIPQTIEVDPSGRRRVAWIAMLIAPVIALLLDRDPGLYFRGGYWRVVSLWTWGIGLVALWNLGVVAHASMTYARGFSELGRNLREVDLFEPNRYRAFARQGLRSAVPGVVLLSFLALNMADQGWGWVMGVLGPLTLAGITLALFLPMRGIHARIGEAKQEELDRVHAALKGDSGALTRLQIGKQPQPPGVADLLAYRQFVTSVSEWPFDAPLRARFVLYVAIPLGSWLGGAFVERLLDVALD